jgi:multiple sugar transport system substrate-binding protein
MKRMKRRFGLVVLAGLVLVSLACGRGVPGAPSGSAVTAGDVDSVQLTRPVELLFWHRQAGDSETLQQQIIDEFMAANPNIRIKAEALGDYDKLYQKTLSAIQAGAPPDLVAAYESQAAEYYEAGALIPFDELIRSKKYGLTEAELRDYIPSFLEATKFPQYEGKMLTFPYTKSNLVMYTNMDVLRSLGFDRPAATWDEFLTHCRTAVAAGRQCYAMNIDASGFAAVVFSNGGSLVDEKTKKVRFDEAPVVKTLQLYETLSKEKLAYQIQGTDDQNDLLSGKAMYMIRSSTSLPRLAMGFGDKNRWEVGVIPQGTPDKKRTVLFGANISIMKSTPEKQLAAWQFIKYFTQPDVTARWGLDPSNGYFPVRQSALEKPDAIQYLNDNPHFRQALEVARYAEVEPSIRGWQEVRQIVVDGLTAIHTGQGTAAQVQPQITAKSNQALAQP